MFQTDADKLNFLIETEAELSELVAHDGLAARARDEERPKYITNYIGSKQKLIDWIWKATPEAAKAAVDAFSGSSVVGYMYKTKHLLFIDVVNGQPLLDRSWSFATFGILNPDVSSAAEWIDMDLTMEGQDPSEWTFLLDRTAKRIYRIEEPHEAPPILRGYADIASLTGADVPEGIASDYETGDLFVALRSGGGSDRVLRLGIDWTTQPDPAVTLVETYQIGQSVYGLGYHFADAELTTVITIQDRNQSPVVSRRYEGTGLLRTATPAVAAVINQSGIYEAELLTDPAFWLMPTLEENNGPPDPTYFEPMTGGADSGALTNADYLAGMEATVPKTDTAWIHAVGANTTALWTAVLLHCDQMFELHQAERFAILETPGFTSEYEEGSAGYLPRR